MSLKFNELKLFLRLRDRTVDVVPHYSDSGWLDALGIRIAGEIVAMVELCTTVDRTVDAIIAASKRREESAYCAGSFRDG